MLQTAPPPPRRRMLARSRPFLRHLLAAGGPSSHQGATRPRTGTTKSEQRPPPCLAPSSLCRQTATTGAGPGRCYVQCYSAVAWRLGGRRSSQAAWPTAGWLSLARTHSAPVGAASRTTAASCMRFRGPSARRSMRTRHAPPHPRLWSHIVAHLPSTVHAREHDATPETHRDAALPAFPCDTEPQPRPISARMRPRPGPLSGLQILARCTSSEARCWTL